MDNKLVTRYVAKSKFATQPAVPKPINSRSLLQQESQVDASGYGLVDSDAPPGSGATGTVRSGGPPPMRTLSGRPGVRADAAPTPTGLPRAASPRRISATQRLAPHTYLSRSVSVSPCGASLPESICTMRCLVCASFFSGKIFFFVKLFSRAVDFAGFASSRLFRLDKPQSCFFRPKKTTAKEKHTLNQSPVRLSDKFCTMVRFMTGQRQTASVRTV
jgi:hypothetical protein